MLFGSRFAETIKPPEEDQTDFNPTQSQVETDLYKSLPGFGQLSPEQKQGYSTSSDYLRKKSDPYGTTGLLQEGRPVPAAPEPQKKGERLGSFLQNLIGGGQQQEMLSPVPATDDYQLNLEKAAKGIQTGVVSYQDAITRMKGAYPDRNVEEDLRSLIQK